MSAEERESFLRWQDFRVQQLSFSINLFLGFAVASLAFLLDQDVFLSLFKEMYGITFART
jgi:hypothetical protein